MTEGPFTPEDIATSVAELLNLFSCQAIEHAHTLIPNPETPGNPAIVITARDGSRYGLEVCPIPEPHVLPERPLGGPLVTDREPVPEEDPTDCRATDDGDACGDCDACVDRLERAAALRRPLEYGYGGTQK